jgi:hypothetical protein
VNLGLLFVTPGSVLRSSDYWRDRPSRFRIPLPIGPDLHRLLPEGMEKKPVGLIGGHSSVGVPANG